MAKLSNVKPLIPAAPPLLASKSDDHGHSVAAEPWRRWYKLKRWCGTKSGGWLDGLRGKVLIRDGFVCQWRGCGKVITRRREAIAHHVRAHRGDPVLFWDDSNLITVCKDCHDGPIAAEEAKQAAAGLL